jgi:hypothetical protein
MKEGSLIFKLEHLDRYAIVKEPCTLIVQPKLAMDDLYTEDNSPRWILNLKVISEFNLMLLKELSKEGERNLQ